MNLSTHKLKTHFKMTTSLTIHHPISISGLLVICKENLRSRIALDTYRHVLRIIFMLFTHNFVNKQAFSTVISVSLKTILNFSIQMNFGINLVTISSEKNCLQITSSALKEHIFILEDSLCKNASIWNNSWFY